MRSVRDELLRLRDTLLGMLGMYPKFRMYSGSLLLAYDGDNLEAPPRLALVDFAHAHLDIDADGGNSGDTSFDDGVLLGIDIFIRLTGRT
jgi:hypothetical protein